MIEFITTLYNEEKEVGDLINHLWPYVDRYVIVDDGSTDGTREVIDQWRLWKDRSFLKSFGFKPIEYVYIDHVGMCELGRIEALKHVNADSWVIMLDADERFTEGTLANIVKWIKTNPPQTHMYFDQLEFLDGRQVRTFQKVKVFKKSVAHLPEIIHGDPSFDGDPVSFQWRVIHRKSSDKQKIREAEYVEVYKKLVEDGKIDEGKRKWFEDMHYFIKSSDVVPHG